MSFQKNLKSFHKIIKYGIFGGYQRWKMLAEIKRSVYRSEWSMRRNMLMEKIFSEDSRSGVNKDVLCDEEVIVSLTTYGRRYYDVSVPIESIMQQTVKPNRIILWLGEEMRGVELPVALQRQMKRGLEIEYCKDIRSHTKLIPCLKKYPEASIITIDDDIIYENDLVEKLVSEHRRTPKEIIGNKIHRIILDSSGEPKRYDKWERNITSSEVSSRNFFNGCGGVLYPPHSLDDEVFNEEVFLDICKYADDIWFYSMALKKGTNIRRNVFSWGGGVFC